MDKHIKNYTDEELCIKFQELMEAPHSIKDDSFFDSNEHLFGTASTAPRLNKNLKISLTLSAKPSSTCKDSPIIIRFQADRDVLIKDKQYICFIYCADYYPMCNSEESGSTHRIGQNLIDLEIQCHHIWLPGNYILLVRDIIEGSLSRIDFTLDQSLKPTLEVPKACPLCSPDDVLVSCMENTDANWDDIASTPGTAQLRQYALSCRQLKIYNEFRKALNGKELKEDRNLLIYTINYDWTERLLQAFQKMSVPGNYFTFVDCSSLYNTSQMNPYAGLNEQFNATTNQVYCLTNVNALLNTGGMIIVRHIIEKMKEGDGKYKLWLCGSHHELQSVLEVHPSLRQFFLRGNSLEQQSYTPFELVQTFFNELEEENIEPTDHVKDAIARAIINGYEQGRLTACQLSDIHRFVAEEIRPRYLKHAMRDVTHENEILPQLTIEDIDLGLLPQSTSSFEDSIRELNEMVGLDDIKRTIITMANQSRYYMERRKAGLPTTCNTVYHAVFTGNPGTGKTTVAKMIGKIYHSIGLLSKGEVICADRTRLVGRYIGETEENMKTILEEAHGNVLFIDEAYNLYDGASDQKDYGRKVIDCLLPILSQPNPDMVVIFAGYEKEMDAMLTSNPGLMGRFPYKFRFPDYSGDELMEIACHLLNRDEYILTDEAKTLLYNCIYETVTQRTKHFSNARWVEQFVRNGIVPAIADRVISTVTKDYQHVLKEDIENGFQKFNPYMLELKPRKQIGFRT